MGLDNGIIVKGIPKEEWVKCPSIEPNVEHEFDDETYEVAYWRKCWGVRREILGKFHFGEEGGEFELGVEDIPALCKIMRKFLNPRFFREEADSIWEYEDLVEGFIDTIIRLTWLKYYMGTHPEVKLLFYDSY